MKTSLISFSASLLLSLVSGAPAPNPTPTGAINPPPSVLIQLDTPEEGVSQGTIPTDGSLIIVPDHFSISYANAAEIVGWGGVPGTATGGENFNGAGVGGPVKGGDVIQGVNIYHVRCQAWEGKGGRKLGGTFGFGVGKGVVFTNDLQGVRVGGLSCVG